MLDAPTNLREAALLTSPVDITVSGKEIVIDLGQRLQRQAHVRILNSLGQLVKEQPIAGNGNRTVISMAQQSNGTYFVVLAVEGRDLRQKVVIQ